MHDLTYRYGLLSAGILFFMGAFLAIVPSAAATGQPVVIDLLSEVEVNSDTVYLKELATITTVDPNIRERVGSIAIGRVSVPGKWRSIKRSYIELKLRQFDVDLSQVRLEGSEQVRVRRAAIKADPAIIRRKVTEFLRSHSPWADARLTIDAIEITSDTTMPAGPVDYAILAPKHGPYTGTLALMVVARGSGAYEKRIRTRVKLSATRSVVRARRPIGRLKPITADDLELVSLDIGDLPLDPVTNMDTVIGKRAKNSILARSVLQTELVEFPPVVKRGDMVLIVAQTGGLRITAVGEVRSSGRPGETVKVINVDSRKTIVARVVDKSTVTVDF